MSITFRAWYLRPTPGGTGSLGVYPEDLPNLEEWRTRNGHLATWWYVDHPVTGERLHAFTPVSPGQCDRIEAMGIRPGDLCQVTYYIKIVGGKAQMWFDHAAPLPIPAAAT